MFEIERTLNRLAINLLQVKNDDRYGFVQWRTLGCLIPVGIVLWVLRAFFHHIADMD